MGILARSAILGELHQGRIRVSPLDEKMVGPASIDLHVGSRFRARRKVWEVIEVSEEADFRKVTDVVELTPSDSLLLLPGEGVFATTVETIELPDDICGWIEGRSRFARVGLMVNISSPFLHPGSAGHQAFEIINFGSIALSLRPGAALCQLILARTDGSGEYSGSFCRQEP